MTNFRYAKYDAASKNIDDPSSLTGTTQVALSANKIMTVEDDGIVYNVTTALTVTYPAGLVPRPSNVFILPAAGNLSLAVSGATQLNGAALTLTRARATNFAGIAVIPYVEADGYGVSGS